MTDRFAPLREAESKRSQGAEIVKYGHGGGRVFVDGESGARKLVAEFYHQEDRDFYEATTHPEHGVAALLAEVEKLRQWAHAVVQSHLLKHGLFGVCCAPLPDSATESPGPCATAPLQATQGASPLTQEPGK